MSPAEVPADLVEKMRHAVRPTRREDEVRWMLAAVWDDIYAYGYTDGFSDREQTEEWAAHAAISHGVPAPDTETTVQ